MNKVIAVINILFSKGAFKKYVTQKGERGFTKKLQKVT